MSMRRSLVLGLASALLAGACASGSGHPAASAATPLRAWPIATREHVDLWLHGYAMLTRDASQVPVFRRGYRDSLEVRRRRANLLTGLDANHEKLASLMLQNPEISNGQFLPLYFDSWDAMVQAINGFVRAGGDRARAEPAVRQSFSVLASMYPTVQDREWLRLFTESLGDEYDHFYHQYWLSQEEARRGVVDAVDSLWDSVRPRFQRFLTSTHQVGGDLVLSLVLGGEGRTLNASPDHNEMVVAMPDSRLDAAEAIYGFAHEAVQTIAGGAVNDNTSAEEQRNGTAAIYSPLAAVRGGAILLGRVAPELSDGYMRFYLAQAGVTPPRGNVSETFNATFVLPTAIVAQMERQIGAALGGI